MRRAVILNDTRGHDHFGCHRVMETIERKLSLRGFEVSARSLVRQRWWKNEDFLQAMSDCDLILINGEGTLHHGSPHALSLLKVAEHPKRRSTPVALVNALYQDNPPEWKRYVDRIDYLNTRDTRSANHLEQIAKRPVRNTLDFSLCGDCSDISQAERSQLALGDSVVREANAALLRFARSIPHSTFLPIVRTIKSSKPQAAGLRYALREAYIHAHTYAIKRSLRNAVFCSDHKEYCNRLRQCYLHLTGRFHGVCLSIATNTPFIGLTSNSWKVEALLDDIGFGHSRMLTTEQLQRALGDRENFAFSPKEQGLLKTALQSAETETDAVFDEIAALA